MAILGQWDDEDPGGPALLRACGLTAGQASQLAATLLPAEVAGRWRPEWSLVRIHPGGSGLDPRGVLDRLLGITRGG